MARVHYDIGGKTDKGNVRAQNQDSLLIRQGSFGGEEFALLAVADGMGGEEHGERASGETARALESWWRRELKTLWDSGFRWEEASDSLSAAIEEVNRRLYFLGKERGVKSGTTLSLAFLYQDRFLLKHVGDSRIYKVGKKGLTQLTRDHTWCQQQIERGMMTQGEAKNHEKRHALVNAVGGTEELYIDTALDALGAAEGLLICSDGFYNPLSARELESVLIKKGKSEEKLNRLFEKIKEAEADDNLTAILIQRRHAFALF